jgi:hypothetical protein
MLEKKTKTRLKIIGELNSKVNAFEGVLWNILKQI